MAGMLSRLRRLIDTPVLPADAAERAQPSPVAAGAGRAEAAQVAFASLPAVRDAILSPGWSIRRFLFDLPPLVLAELERRDVDGVPTGEIAYWILAADGRFVANEARAVEAAVWNRVRSLLLATIAARLDDPPRFERLAAGLRSLDRPFRLDLLHHVSRVSESPILAALDFRAGQDGRFAVTDDGGGLGLLIDNRLEWPITMGGVSLARLEPGWRVSHVLTCFAPLLVLELRHPDGSEASWVLDGHCRRIDDEGFSHPEVIAVLRALAPGMIRRHWQQILSLADASPGHETLPILALNTRALHRVLYRVRDLVVPETVDEMLADPQPPIVLPPTAAAPDGLVLGSEHVVRAVRHDLFEAGIAAVRRGGRLCWPSPVDGSDAELEAVFAPQEYTMVYQFRDRNGLRFMVATGERDCVLLGLYLPDQNRFLCDKVLANAWFRGLIPAEFWWVLYEYCVLHKDRLPGRRRGAGAEIANVFMTQPLLHIGHYVWNDLTGQAAIVRALGADAPRSIVIGAPGGQAEFFGPIDVLFPEMAGKVDRRLASKPDFITRVLESSIVPIRMTRSFVDAALRDTVRRHMSGTEWAGHAERQHAASGGGPVLIVGLRVEDRTFADPAAFYEALIDHLHATRAGTVLVMDGRNAPPGGRQGTFIPSIKDHLSRRAPLRVEQELVARLQAHAADRNVTVIDVVGLPIEACMAWCYRATACIAPWGAGLAKYRWLANLPTLALTSRFNLLHRQDLDIYHSPHWMERPSPLLLPDPDKVTDRLDVSGNAPADYDPQGRECFEVELPHVWSLLDRLLNGTAAAGTSGRDQSVA